MPKVTHGEEALSTLMIETPDDSFASSMSPCSIYCQGMDLAFSVNGRLHMCLCLFWRAHCVIQETDVCVFQLSYSGVASKLVSGDWEKVSTLMAACFCQCAEAI